ncbi:hypothetical protein ACWFRB_06245 [Rhodococcus sp. NPDC055112]
MRVGPGEKLSRRVRCASVGSTTAAVAVAAHGVGGGGLPTGSTLMLLVGFSAVLVAVMAAVPVLRRGGPALVPILAVGQLGAHTTLAFGGGGHHADMASGPIGGMSPQMLAAHAVAIGVCAALIAAAERIGPRTEAALRAVVAALVVAIPVLERPRSWQPVAEVNPLVSALCRVSVSRRGPPLFV